ncbi:PhzF family phenazine biosynthesis protein [Vibrio sp. 10N]|uniref:PhzF family phenazine biosynthesis protein n=1 Tax=Vibrio sp. 10N TaxID=3058938 RepID=UPI002812C7E0|nr:PhzF family phenazine biosynthesis protein [Vibrio sp. 10N]
MIEQWIVDAFTEVPFKGNSAAIIIVDDYQDETWMQNVAIENNLSETAFLKPLNENHYFIRWFSPIMEIDFCGHATLASAFVLFEQLGLSGTLTFSTEKVGDLLVTKGEQGRIEMTFPNRAPISVSDAPKHLIEGLSIQPVEILRNEQAYFAIYEEASAVRALTTDNDQLKKLAPYDVVATALSDDEQFDFVSRYFWPANGGDEDPVTGSIHAGLMPYWGNRLNKASLTALQASERTGVLYGLLKHDKVLISGDAVLFAKSQLFV